jgi:exodeoxyribonuclease VII large subunit
LIEGEQRQMRSVEQRLTRLHPQRMLDLRRQQLDDRERRLHFTMQRRLDRLHDRTSALGQQLKALNPLRVLGRGYSIVQKQNGQVVHDPQHVAQNERLQVRAAEGSYTVIVAEQKNGEGRLHPL